MFFVTHDTIFQLFKFAELPDKGRRNRLGPGLLCMSFWNSFGTAELSGSINQRQSIDSDTLICTNEEFDIGAACFFSMCSK
jgi:hypothetical protein